MSEPGYTKGPWVAERRLHCSVVLQTVGRTDGYANRVAECPQWSHAAFPQPTPDEAFANARLIASAPDLLEALKDVTIHLIAAVSLLQKIHGDLAQSKKHALFNTKIGDYNRSVERGRAAILKAEGKS